MRILYVSAIAFSTAVVLRGQCRYLRQQGFEVIVAASPSEDLRRLALAEDVTVIPITIHREISPFHDLVSLWQLFAMICKVRPDIVNVGTPKAGLLAGLAAWVARVPCRIYWLHGLRLETTHGLKRRILRLAERVACRAASVVPCVSPSVRDVAVAARLVPSRKTMLLGDGSANGVDVSRFIATPERLAQASRIRADLQIPEDARVVGYVGRLTRDKGIGELVGAFLALLPQFETCRLLLVGGFEDEDPVPEDIRRTIADHPRIIMTGFVADPAPYYHIMDVLAFPSYREGFGTIVLEAHCAKRPVVGTRVTGLVDSIVHGVNGLLVPVGDCSALSQALSLVLNNSSMSRRLGEQGFLRVKESFQCESVWNRIEAFYLDLLQSGWPANVSNSKAHPVQLRNGAQTK
jgi:glycosyltransferase involved in cell wall biosynthesis